MQCLSSMSAVILWLKTEQSQNILILLAHVLKIMMAMICDLGVSTDKKYF